MADQILRKLSLEEESSQVQESTRRKSFSGLSSGAKRVSDILRRRRSRREIYLNENPPKKGNLFLGILFLVIIVIASFWGLSKAGRERSLSTYERVLVGAQQDLDESVGLIELNPTRAKELALSAKKVSEELTGRGIKDDRLKNLQNSLAINLPKILGEYKIEPNILVDLGLAKDGFNTTSVSASEGRIVALDREKHVVLTFDFDGGSMQALAGESSIPEAKLITTDARAVFVLDGLRIARITIEKEPTIRSLVLPEGNWGRIVALGAYGGSLYLVDDVKSQIWKYSGSVERVGEGESWLNFSDEPPDFDGTISMAIDGSLWLLNRDGEIDRFVQGKEVAFRISELEKSLAAPRVLVTDQDSQYLYILDSGNSRIVVLDKSGKYKAQYSWDRLAEAASIAVSEEKKKILLFVGSKVYETELKN